MAIKQYNMQILPISIKKETEKRREEKEKKRKETLRKQIKETIPLSLVQMPFLMLQ